MIAFWVTAGVLSAVAAMLVLFRAAKAATLAEPVEATPILYRRQIAEIGDLADRGLLGAAERKSAEAEAARRMLAAADQPAEVWTTQAPGRGPVLLAVIAAPALALGLYLGLGSPGMADQPFAGRLQHWLAANPASLTPPEMAAVLGKLTKERPNDPEGFRYLALAEGAAQNPAGAVRALHRAIKIAPERADLWEMLGEALIMQAGGEVTSDARAAFAEDLKRDPKAIAARFHLARAKIEGGDKATGLAEWRALAADIPAGDPRLAALNEAITEAEAAPAAPAAAPVSGEQMAAIRGMVAGLAERLKAQPDDPEGWVRLVRAYAVLGETAKREAALKDASTRFAKRPDILDQLAKAASAEPMR
ncbi:MAG: c-type cytochrome biogenesis protein CcmI [Phenylobacterium sp.]